MPSQAHQPPPKYLLSRTSHPLTAADVGTLTPPKSEKTSVHQQEASPSHGKKVNSVGHHPQPKYLLSRVSHPLTAADVATATSSKNDMTTGDAPNAQTSGDAKAHPKDAHPPSKYLLSRVSHPLTAADVGSVGPSAAAAKDGKASDDGRQAQISGTTTKARPQAKHASFKNLLSRVSHPLTAADVEGAAPTANNQRVKRGSCPGQRVHA